MEIFFTWDAGPSANTKLVEPRRPRWSDLGARCEASCVWSPLPSHASPRLPGGAKEGTQPHPPAASSLRRRSTFLRLSSFRVLEKVHSPPPTLRKESCSASDNGGVACGAAYGRRHTAGRGVQASHGWTEEPQGGLAGRSGQPLVTASCGDGGATVGKQVAAARGRRTQA